MRTDLVISNPPDLRNILPTRSKIARATSPEPAIPEKNIELRQLEQRIACDDSYIYRESTAFDINGEFLPPLSFGMTAYRSVEGNSARGPERGNNLSVYV